MSTLSITKTYDDGEVLNESDLDNIIDDVEEFLNVTKINDDNIQNAGITASSKIITGTVVAASLASDSVTTGKILDLAVTTAKINDLAVTAAKLAADAVTTAKILDSNVTTAKIADSNITLAKMADSSVGTTELVADSVTTAKILDANVTRAKLVSVGQQISSSCGTYNLTAAEAAVTNLTVTITTTGRPVMVFMQSADPAAGSFLSLTTDSDDVQIVFRRDATEIASWNYGITSISGLHKFGISPMHLDIPGAGTYTYTVRASGFDGLGTEGQIRDYKLVAYEL